MEIVIKIIQFLLSLSLLVVLHELGHFLPAKLFKTKVEKFYLFFDPWFSLLKIKKNETEYGIGWLPLGGYVKIAGMIDESMDTEQLKKPAEPWEFRSKPAWQRLIIMAGGVTVNLLLGFFIYAMLAYNYGEVQISNSYTPFGYQFSAAAQSSIGLRNGDQILAIDDAPVAYFNQITEKMITAHTITVLREDQQMRIDIPADFLAVWQNTQKKEPFVQLRFPFIVGGIQPDSPNQNLEIGDAIIAIADQPVRFFDEAKSIFEQYSHQTVPITILRNGENIHLSAQVNEQGRIGIAIAPFSLQELSDKGFYKAEEIRYGFFESFPKGISKGWNTLVNYVKQLGLFFRPETKAYQSIGGFASIGSMFPTHLDGYIFWNITATLSIILAFMNILPIPALDGGHILFLLYEIITGKAPNQKFLEIAQTIGMIFLFGLLLWANGNDFLRFFNR